MELKKNFHIPNPQIQEPKTNPLPAPIQVLDDSETYESSQKCKTDYSEKKSLKELNIHLLLNCLILLNYFLDSLY